MPEIKIINFEDRPMTLLSGRGLELFEKLMEAQGDSNHIDGREKFKEEIGGRDVAVVSEKIKEIYPFK